MKLSSYIRERVEIMTRDLQKWEPREENGQMLLKADMPSFEEFKEELEEDISDSLEDLEEDISMERGQKLIDSLMVEFRLEHDRIVHMRKRA